MSSARSLLGWSAFVLATSLIATRIGLLLHELVGHGLVSMALGGELDDWSLHAFGGVR